MGIAQATGVPYNALYNNITVNDPAGYLTNANLIAVAEGALTAAGLGAPYTLSSTPGTIARFQEIEAGLLIAQADATTTLGSPFDGLGQLPTGATHLGLNHGLSLFAEYPEIETWGFSFNTNIAGHGLQGDFSYRPDMPIQIDTDVLTINALFLSLIHI